MKWQDLMKDAKAMLIYIGGAGVLFALWQRDVFAGIWFVGSVVVIGFLTNRKESWWQ